MCRGPSTSARTGTSATSRPSPQTLGCSHHSTPSPRIQPEGGAAATEAQLLALKGDVLQELCAQRGIKAARRARKDVMVGLLPPP